jgi:hypothetical protein
MDRARNGLLDIADKVRGGDAIRSVGLPNISCAEVQALKPVLLCSLSSLSVSIVQRVSYLRPIPTSVNDLFQSDVDER